MNVEKESSLPDTTELLQRILNTVEPTERKPWFEMACAIVLALATTASAWCAYQSKLWGGAQAARAVLLFLGTLVQLATMPVCHE